MIRPSSPFLIASASSLWLYCLIITIIALGSCRAAHDNESEALNVTKTWFNAYGDQGSCESVDSCEDFDNDQDFSDKCVAAGFAVRPCGCELRCSGDSGYRKKRVAKKSQLPIENSGCDQQTVNSINDLAQASLGRRMAGSCVTGYLCKGHTIRCGDKQLIDQIRKVRTAAKKEMCGSLAAKNLCGTKLLETIYCEDQHIRSLSASWERTFEGKDDNAKRCIVESVCNERPAQGCSAAIKRQLAHVEAAINSPGCQYWLAYFCQLSAREAL